MLYYMQHWDEGRLTLATLATTPGSAVQTAVTELKQHGNVVITKNRTVTTPELTDKAWAAYLAEGRDVR